LTKAEFQAALHDVLAEHAAQALQRIQRTLERIPQNARSLDFEVFASQDGDGAFDVRATLDGPDLYVLNKAIAESAEVLGVTVTAAGMSPPVPAVDAEVVDFDVNDAIVDCVALWLQSLWRKLKPRQPAIPVTVVCHDGYGTLTPLKLTA
jgi:hypothetical protein